MHNNKRDIKKQVTIDINKIKKVFYQYYLRDKFEEALDVLAFFGEFMYQVNQQYFDFDAEDVLKGITKRLSYNINIGRTNPKRVLFYDGFGIERRGLELIYIRALIENEYEIFYVVPEKKIKDISITTQLISNANGKIIKMPTLGRIKEIKWMTDLINDQNISKYFLYIRPNDVVPIVTAMLCEGKIDRFQINLTDHAFWLGKNAFDCCIEFRDYGADVSFEKRQIDKKKIVKLPYYPNINKEITFKGFPFEREGHQVMFSGGSLYKTFGDDNVYYKLVKEILDKEKNLIFLYAGQGDRSGLEELKKSFPERVYWMDERNDLYQIMKHSDIYFSTYPMIGGLMSQYAIAAKKIPITLLHDDCGKGVILHQDKAFFEFKDPKKLIDFVHEILNDHDYKEQCENQLEGETISIDEFNQGVKDILDRQETKFKIDYNYIDTNNFQLTYIERLNFTAYLKLWFKKDFLIFRHFPIRFMLGFMCRLVEKLKQIII